MHRPISRSHLSSTFCANKSSPTPIKQLSKYKCSLCQNFYCVIFILLDLYYIYSFYFSGYYLFNNLEWHRCSSSSLTLNHSSGINVYLNQPHFIQFSLTLVLDLSIKPYKYSTHSHIFSIYQYTWRNALNQYLFEVAVLKNFQHHVGKSFLGLLKKSKNIKLRCIYSSKNIIPMLRCLNNASI